MCQRPAAFGNINSIVTARWDIADVWAVGDISSTSTARQDTSQCSLNTGDPTIDALLGQGVFSGGTISARFTASTGVIDLVWAVGSINASVTA